MSKMQEAYPDHPPGSPQAILRILVERDPRSPRRISLDSGMSADAVRNALRLADATPRRKTLEALARSLGIDVRVLLGELPIPERPETSSEPTAMSSSGKNLIARNRPLDAVLTSDAPRVRRVAGRAAIRRALESGLRPENALTDAVMAAQLAAVAAGMDEVEAAEAVARIGIG